MSWRVRGIEVERSARTIEIRRLELVAQRPDALDLLLRVRQGAPISVFSVRTSPNALGTLGHLTRLRRNWVEPFRDMAMCSLEAALADAENRGSGLFAG